MSGRSRKRKHASGLVTWGQASSQVSARCWPRRKFNMDHMIAMWRLCLFIRRDRDYRASLLRQPPSVNPPPCTVTIGDKIWPSIPSCHLPSRTPCSPRADTASRMAYKPRSPSRSPRTASTRRVAIPNKNQRRCAHSIYCASSVSQTTAVSNRRAHPSYATHPPSRKPRRLPG